MPPINGEIAVWAEPTAATKPPPMDPSFYAADRSGGIASARAAIRAGPLSSCESKTYADAVLDLSNLDVDEIANALSDQTAEHRWLIDPGTGEIAFWTEDTGIDGQNPVDLDELDLTPIDPMPSYVWYQDMADFAERVSDEGVGRRLARALDGKGAFRRFKRELYEEYPELVSAWHAFRDTRARRRAVEWLLGEGLIEEATAEQFLGDNQDPEVP